MQWKSVDAALYGLFDIAAKSPQSVKSIFFSSGCKVDANSIRGTIDYNNSRIPAERITLARETLSRCYDSIDNHLAALFMLYNFGYLDCYCEQIKGGLVILTNEDIELVATVLRGYRDKKATPLADIATVFDIDYRSAHHKCTKIRKQIAKIHHEIWESAEDLLINSGFLNYFENIA